MNTSKATWLVTGGAGYIGAHVSRLLESHGFTVLVIDSLDTGLVDRLPTSVEFRKGHISDIAAIYPDISPGSLSGIVHLAGMKNARESHDYPLLYWKNNVAELMPFLEWTIKQKVPRFIFSSSSSVYGHQSGVTEESETRPVSPYGRTKLTGEAILNDVASRFGFSLCALRYFNVVGCGDYLQAHDDGVDNVVPRFVRAGLGSEPMQIYGTSHETPDGSCLRDYVDVRDLAEAHVRVAIRMLSGEEIPKVINVGIGAPSSVLEVAQQVASVMNLRENTILECAPHVADPAEVWASESSLLKSLGWDPQYSLADSIHAHVKSMTLTSETQQ